MKLPARYAFGFSETISIARCILHYRRLGLDPGYDSYFEDLYTSRFVEFMGGDGYADGVSSGCASIYIAIKSLGLPSGSVIATSPVTDASVIGCITEQGHIPYLIDSDPYSYNISVDTLRNRFDPKIRALVVTHAAGQPCEMPAIAQFCSDNNIELIEDCSQAIGAVPTTGDLKVGSYGRFGCFSTMYRKNLSVSGSSGLLFASDYDDYRLAKQHADRGKKWWNKELVDMRDPGFADFPGLNWNTDEFRSAIGLANIKKLDYTNSKRRLFLSQFLNFLSEFQVRLFKPYSFHQGFAPFYFPIFINKDLASKSVYEISTDLRDLGLGIGVKYGCLVSTWDWARPYMYDDFSAPNALRSRDECFHLYLNENYSIREARNIALELSKYEKSLLS